MLYSTQLLRKVQLHNELLFSESYVTNLVRTEIFENPDICILFSQFVWFTREWREYDHTQEWNKVDPNAKNNRLALLTDKQCYDLATDVIVKLAVARRQLSYNDVVASCVHNMPHSEMVDKLTTAAELITLMGVKGMLKCFNTDQSIVTHEDKETGEVTKVISVAPLILCDAETNDKLDMLMHVPPMIVKPALIQSNSDCAYLTERQHKNVMLGKHNFSKTRQLSLDVINMANSVEYSLDLEYLTMIEDVLSVGKKSKLGIITPKMQEEFLRHQQQATAIMVEMVRYGNRFYLTHHFDTAERLYCRGHHISYMGKKFKQAALDFKNGEDLEVPDDMKNWFSDDVESEPVEVSDTFNLVLEETPELTVVPELAVTSDAVEDDDFVIDFDDVDFDF